MKKDHMTMGLNTSWHSCLWILKFICAPITIPLLLFRLILALRPREPLQDKVVIITGASSGIGEALAHKLYAEGCRIVLAARRLDELQRVKNDLLSIHPTVPTHVPVVMQIDLADLNALPGHVGKILDIFGKLDILINNGGVSYRGSAFETVLDVDIKIMLVNYFGQIAFTKAVLPQLLKQKSGHIVFINSMQGKIGLPRRSAYAASKHALLGFADSLRAEVHKDNIRVTTVCPSYVKTDLSKNALTSTGDKYGKMDNTTNKGSTPDAVAEEIVNAIIYRKNEITLGPFYRKIFIYGRNLLTPIYFKVLEKFENDACKQ